MEPGAFPSYIRSALYLERQPLRAIANDARQVPKKRGIVNSRHSQAPIDRRRDAPRQFDRAATQERQTVVSHGVV